MGREATVECSTLFPCDGDYRCSMHRAGRKATHTDCHADAADSYDHGYADGVAADHRYWWGQVFCLGMLAGVALLAFIQVLM